MPLALPRTLLVAAPTGRAGRNTARRRQDGVESPEAGQAGAEGGGGSVGRRARQLWAVLPGRRAPEAAPTEALGAAPPLQQQQQQQMPPERQEMAVAMASPLPAASPAVEDAASPLGSPAYAASPSVGSLLDPVTPHWGTNSVISDLPSESATPVHRSGGSRSLTDSQPPLRRGEQQ